jgi:Ni/Co efflux regulator RcnB
MRRFILLAAAAAGLAATLPAEAPAAAPGRGHERGWSQHDPGERGRRDRDDGRHGRDRDRTPRYDPGPRDDPRDRAAPPPRMLRAPQARRGGYLPDSYRGGVVDDYRAYRLRPPPRGFAWIRTGSGFALVDMADGRIYDMVQ